MPGDGTRHRLETRRRSCEATGFPFTAGRAVVGLVDLADRAPGRAEVYCTFSSVWAMIAGPEMFTPQGGNSLTVKKLSGRSVQKFSPSLSPV